MRQLLLLRHAKSAWDDARLTDHARPLNPRGRRAATAMAAALRELGLTTEAILVSSARRTRQTLDALAPFEGTPIVTLTDGLYLAPWRGILDMLRAVPDSVRSVMVIGHNPGLHELALALAGPAGLATPAAQRLAEGYPTGALVELAIATPWHALEPGDGRLVRFLVPADLGVTDAASGGPGDNLSESPA